MARARTAVRQVCIIAAATMVHATLAQSPTPSPQAVIPNEATRVRVAEAILASQHSVRDMEGWRPLQSLFCRAACVKFIEKRMGAKLEP